MAIQTAAGSTFAIATGLPSTYDATGFTALTWQVVAEITDIGDFGKDYTLVTHMPVGSRQVKKLKGAYNNGQIQLQMAHDVSVGSNQLALKTARDNDASYSFKITLQDGTHLYFTGKVMSYKTHLGGVDKVVSSTTTVEVDGDILEI